ncbi:MAG TPA: ATP-binding protein [Longimicrobiales bacterium]|nr:ATP-binding protein [Longimicrobiales bacterium]
MRLPRLRLTVALPICVVVLIAAGFIAAAFSVLPDDGAAGSARLHRWLLFWGALTAGAGWLVTWILTGVLTEPLERLRRHALHPDEPPPPGPAEMPFAEVRNALWAVDQMRKDYAGRLAGAAREREELEALVGAVSEGILHVAADGRLVRVNPAAMGMLGLHENATGQRLGTVIRNAALREALMRAMQERRLDPRELPMDERWLLVAADPLAGGGIAVTLMDLTDLRRLEEVRRDFVANASHELKTPLTSIRGYAETLLHGDLPAEEARAFLDIVARNAERLQHIVDDLLDLSRLESGRWQPDVEAADVGQIAREAWRGAYANTAVDRGIRFDLEGAGLLANADPRALEQIFGNLFGNALRHVPDGGHITVRVSHRQRLPGTAAGQRRAGGVPAGPWVFVEVKDDGTGVPHDALSRIFERFYRVDPARSRAEGGTGLGLSIVKHLVESMGGVVWAESELGRGTTIAFVLRPGPPDELVPAMHERAQSAPDDPVR